jgi:hydroxymethylpyrimidine pyrophosphatase-like HAD family hydrolase
MAVWLITDLDDTWVSTARKTKDLTQASNVIDPESRYEPTYLSAKAEKVWQIFQQNTSTLPITGRSWESAAAWVINGVSPWHNGGIFSHGACIKAPNGLIDTTWQKYAEQHITSAAYQEALAVWHDYVLSDNWTSLPDQRMHALPWSETECPLGWVAKAKSQTAEHQLKHYVEKWRNKASSLGLNVFHQKNHITVMPMQISKLSAFIYWKQHYASNEDTFIGCGDAPQDIHFMKECDWWMTPSQSDITQLFPNNHG